MIRNKVTAIFMTDDENVQQRKQIDGVTVKMNQYNAPSEIMNMSIKNAEGKDSPETAIKLYKNFYKIGE